MKCFSAQGIATEVEIRVDTWICECWNFRMMGVRISTLLLMVALASGCAHLNRVPPGPPVTREQVMQTAEAYANHPWQASAANIFHGTDTNGVHIDTPDVAWFGPDGWYADGRTNIGVPYCWGGDSTLAEFDAGVRAGRPVGYQFKKLARNSHDAGKDPQSSALPVGVDCSGLVSRCWQLDQQRSTYNMAQVCRQLPSFDDLLPGDALNKPYDHIILFAGWADPQHEHMRVVEAIQAGVREDVHSRASVVAKGFEPLRYNEIQN